eukprot:3511218-Pyramimonas_sp.AAC.1
MIFDSVEVKVSHARYAIRRVLSTPALRCRGRFLPDPLIEKGQQRPPTTVIPLLDRSFFTRAPQRF